METNDKIYFCKFRARILNILCQKFCELKNGLLGEEKKKNDNKTTTKRNEKKGMK